MTRHEFSQGIDVVIPVRRNSQGLARKGLLNLIDRPLFMHSVACATMIPGVRRIFVTTDDKDVAEFATRAGVFVPELRPPHLCTPETPMVEVLRYAYQVFQQSAHGNSEWLMLLDPTSPLRDPIQIAQAFNAIEGTHLSGFVGVSQPHFNPIWVGVAIDDQGFLKRHSINPGTHTRRQTVPAYLRISGNLYAWHSNLVENIQTTWLDDGTYMPVEIDDIMSYSIDTLNDFKLVEAILRQGLVRLPWMVALP